MGFKFNFMYSAKEKLYHFRQLSNPLAVEADLSLLHEKNPQSTDFTRFDLAPRKNAEDILFALLDVADHDDIVRNRREFFSQQEADNEPPTNPDGNPVIDGEGNKTPTNPDGNPVVDGEGNEKPTVPQGTPVENSVDNSGKNKVKGKPKKPDTPKKKKKSIPK